MELLKKLLPHAIAFVAIFFSLFLYLSPYFLEDKVLQQSDIKQAEYSQAEMTKIQKETGSMPYWTNSMFGGMPSYQIYFAHKSNPITFIGRSFMLGQGLVTPWVGLFVIMISFYLLFLLLGVRWPLALIGAIAFGFSTNNIILLEAGHLTKLTTTGFMALIISGVFLVLRKQYLLGGVVVALATGLDINANHVQLTYYLFIILALLAITAAIQLVKDGDFTHLWKALTTTVIAIALGATTGSYKLLPTLEYQKETIRGESELSKAKDSSSGSGKDVAGGGLSYDYAFNWSYGIGETYNLIYPAYRGGSSFRSFVEDENSATYELYSSGQFRGLDQRSIQSIFGQGATEYWGDQPFTSGPVYLGAVCFFLFILGLFFVPAYIRNWAIAATLLCVFIAWGKNYQAFNYFLFDHFPMFNKFRSITMILGIAGVIMMIVGVMGLHNMFKDEVSAKERLNGLMKAGAITGGIMLAGVLWGFIADFGAAKMTKDLAQLPAQYLNPLIDAVTEDRSSLFWTDIARSWVLVGLAFGVLWYAVKGKFSTNIAIWALGAIMLFDYLGVDRRYLNSDSFEERATVDQSSNPEKADLAIMKDPDPHYRVLDFRGRNPFQNAQTSMFHKSLGGYHAAKLMRYQELVEKYLGKGVDQRNQPIYNMLNAKYFIGENGEVQQNPGALGNAWFVKKITFVKNGDEEMAMLDSLDTRNHLIVQDAYAANLKGFDLQYDSTATIKLTSYHPDKMVYQYSAKTDQVAVFSEVYYSKGWQLLLNGKPLELTKGNFLLRVAKLPAGTNEIQMVFAPKSVSNGVILTWISSLIILAVAAYIAFKAWKGEKAA